MLKMKNRSKSYYHIFIMSSSPMLHDSPSVREINIGNIEPYYNTVFKPYLRKDETLILNGKRIYVRYIQSLHIYKTQSEAEHPDDIFESCREDEHITHDALRFNLDITQLVLSKAVDRISKPHELISTVLTSNRVLGISVCLISLLSLISTIGKVALFSRIQLGISSLIAIESLPLVLFGKWEWQGFSKLATFLGIALTIALQLFAG